MFQRSMRTVTLALAVATLPMAATAGQSYYPENRPGPPTEDNGMILGGGAGWVVGGLVAGPPGMVAGLLLGGAAGDAVHRRVERDELMAAAATAVAERERLAERLESLRADRARLTAELADVRRSAASSAVAGDLTLDVLFRTGAATLTAPGRERLDALAGLLRRQPALRVSLVGHADRRGAEDANQALSRQRAETVRRTLVGHGVVAARIATTALGESRADAQPGDPDGLALDRRVAIRLESATAPEPDVVAAAE